MEEKTKLFYKRENVLFSFITIFLLSILLTTIIYGIDSTFPLYLLILIDIGIHIRWLMKIHSYEEIQERKKTQEEILAKSFVANWTIYRNS